ncbi:MAG: response regulator [Actinomycetota bacterium]
MSTQIAGRERRDVPESPIRVLLVDDHEIVRRGIRTRLEAEPGILVAGEARGVTESLEVADATRPDVVITEARLSDGSGVEATRRILSAHPQTRVLVLTSLPDESLLFDAIGAGASGFLLKQTTGDGVVRAVRTVASGRSLVDPAIAGSVLDRLRGGKRYPKGGRLATLSPREQQILRLLGEGRSSRKIGDELHLAEKTVRNYVSRILSKLGVRSRAEGVAYLARELRSEGASRASA